LETPDLRVMPNGESRLPSLTGLRFVAAIIVVLAHSAGFLLFRTGAFQENIPALIFTGVLFSAANVAVSFFFVLSGFILTWVAQPGDTKRLFWRRRVVKVYPNHLVAFAITTVLMLTAGIGLTFSNTVPSALLIQSWIPIEKVSHVDGGNTPTWTLACEVLFYLLFPWLLLGLRKVRAEHLWRWAGGLVVAIVAIPAVAKVLPNQPRMQWDPVAFWEYWFVTQLPAVRLLEFALGIVMALIVMNGRWIGMRLRTAMPLLAVGIFIATFVPDEFDQSAVTALPVALMIAACAAADVRGTRTGFGGRTMVWLGEISFAMYIIHFLVVSYGPMGTVYPSYMTRTWTVAEFFRDVTITIAVSIVLAWLMYTFVERPAMKHWARPKRRVHATTPAEAPVSPAPATAVGARKG